MRYSGGIIPFTLLIISFFGALISAESEPSDQLLTAADQYLKPAWATKTGADKNGNWADLVISSITQRMRWIPSGTFTMGSPANELGRFPAEIQHGVTLTRGFWMGDSVCTQALWQAVMGTQPSEFEGDFQRPVEHVSWDDCQGFCAEINCLAFNLQARLPTEAEWEYACRAGTTGPYNGENLDAVGWHNGNALSSHPVKQKSPNAWGLYDMHGSLWQWCSDWYGEYPANAITDPTGPPSGGFRVTRGGCWVSNSNECRSAMRQLDGPGDRFSNLGFRLCVSDQSGSKDKFLSELVRRAKSGLPTAQVALGDYYRKNNDFKNAFYWYDSAARQNNAAGEFALGRCYSLGEGVNRDDKEVYIWLRKSALQGLGAAEYNLAICYVEGLGIDKDFKEAIKWLELAKTHGVTEIDDQIKELKNK
jgi:formylglycine-generating enzyme